MNDLRYAIRALRAVPVVTCVAILSLALGMGANTAIFSILNSLLLKPLPVHEPHRLIALGTDEAPEGVRLTYAAWKQLRDQKVLDRAFAWAMDHVDVVDPAGGASAMETIWASSAFFDVLGVPAAAGRVFGEADDRRSPPDGPVAVISYGLWQRRFGGAPDAIGRTLTIERVPFTIAGVTPREFFGLHVGSAFDIILPLETEPLLRRVPSRLDSEFWSSLNVIARLPSNGTAETATAILGHSQPHIRASTMPPFDRAEDRDRYLGKPWIASSATTGSSYLRSRYSSALVTLLATSGLVLLVACANVANLLLARIAARRYEFSVRLALGGSRLRLMRQLLAESLLLSAIGAALGFVFARWGSRLLVDQLSTWASTAFLDLTPDWRVFGVTAALAAATALLFGTAPALRAARAAPIEALKQQTRGGSTERSAWISSSLVVMQIAGSLVLVAGAGLFLRSFTALAYRDLGFERDRVLVAVVDAKRIANPPGGYAALYERLRVAAASAPGVESAAASMATPLGSLGNVRYTPVIEVPGGAQVRLLTNPVSEDWFRTFGTRLVAGRDFAARDHPRAPRVAIVNEAFARKYFDRANPVGRTIAQVSDPQDRQVLQIVGVVADAAFTSVRDPAQPIIYTPLAQGATEDRLAAFPHISISVRAAQGPPAALTRAVSAGIRGVHADLLVTFLTVSAQLDVFYIRERLLAMLSGFFGALALVLAGLGLYGIASYAVSRRRAEIGIRMALGATPRGVVRMVLHRAAILIVVGIVAGTVVSMWLSRLIRTLLYGVEPRDLVSFTAAPLLLAVIGLLAVWLPARRAARVDPATVLREG